MNAFIDPARLQPDLEPGLASQNLEDAQEFRLKRTGRKAVKFTGWQLVEAIGTSHGKQVWHDVNIYRTTGDHVVVEMIVQTSVAETQAVHRVNSFANLNDAASWLEAYQPGADVPIPAGLKMTEAALPWAMLQAVQMRHTLDVIDRDYRALLSDVFLALDISDPADGLVNDGAACEPALAAEP